ncbi:hypothetical protein GLOTRDRAFT_80104 [Gloeophyllum trabeum ATCC 11539]|uniref:Uncharacterized protein n=1 Tax=Gloeophyllum trabeum (strain ATCC 11539 / FP-39264 / Madison 617) TaxID=670483 RepID=S7RJR2_GLOTA|nr:uncharacterized protein GLOTRDRAFT_80104 [Gloeophyllum trabeum ATCC 11539]EPQ52879.1 hypothetical protein GLOTRDRAFT_80104 [Gloeophyllum trabeum ATCC 11539]
MDVENAQTHSLLAPTPEYLASVSVFPLIPHLKKDVTVGTVDTALSWEQLTASDINFAVVRPLVFKYARLENLAVVYACLVVRAHYISAAEEDLAYSGVMLSRANLCEILAMKLLGRFASSKIQLVAVLTASWSPLAGAPQEVVNQVKEALGGDEDGMNDPQCALEMAITTRAKVFLSSPVVQTVVDDIYSGRVIFSMTSNRSVLADNYKPRAIEIYDYTKTPFLDHYRLRVPKYGAILEFLNFALLLLTFVLCLSNQDVQHMSSAEIVFVIFAVAFALEEYTASKEHGWEIYIANMWNVFDTAFIFVFLCYIVLRIKGLVQDDAMASEWAFDVLACGACILFPRLAFFAIKNNLVVIALRGMISEFVFFMGIAAICFSGLLFTLHTLAGDKWSIRGIIWLMVQIWFGNTYLSFGQAASFHPIFGPILMTGFAALSSTLLLTILISILSNTFARIDANATQEYLFQFAIATIEGVKSDALFSYQPPFNLLAFAILWPASWFVSPRTLHSANVFLIRFTSFPILVTISIYERYFAAGKGLRESGKDAAQSVYNSLPRRLKNMPILDALMGANASDVYDAIFDVDLDQHATTMLFDESDDDLDPPPDLHSLQSRDTLRDRRPMSPSSSRQESRRPPGSPLREGNDRHRSPGGSPRLRGKVLPPLIQTSSSAEVASQSKPSPLSKLFSPRSVRQRAVSQFDLSSVPQQTEAALKRLEGLLEDARDLPVNKLRDEIKELQERQARIESLLLTLTRGMRNETGHVARQGTLP